jgi:hypothetical protein
MVTQLVARSVSRSVRAGPIARAEPGWCVLAVFERACYLVTPSGDVIALVRPEIGNGPLNIVVDDAVQPSRLDQSALFQGIEAGMGARVQDTSLQLGELTITLDQAESWDPQPHWEQLRRNRKCIQGCLPWLKAFALRHSPEGSLLALLSSQAMEGKDLIGFSKPVRSAMSVVQDAAQCLKDGWVGSTTLLQAGVTRLAGLGGGLTPAGDDFLVGVMLRAWLEHPTPQLLCSAMLEAAGPHTTTLSAAFLRATARGECSAAWQHILSSLASGEESEFGSAARCILSHGHTSGADTLAGFLWMEPPPGSSNG